MMLGLPLGFAQPLVLLGLLSLPVLWWLLPAHSAAAARHQLSAGAAALRHLSQGETPQRTPCGSPCCGSRAPRSSSSSPRAAVGIRPVATTTPEAPLALLIDDGFPQQPPWTRAMRSADT